MDLLTPNVGTAKSYKSCVICACLWDMLTQPEFWYDFDGLKRFLEPPCPSHSPIFKLIQKEYCGRNNFRLPDTDQTQDIVQEHESSHCSSQETLTRHLGHETVLLERAKFIPQAHIYVNKPWGGSNSWPLLLALPKEDENKPIPVCYGRVLDQQWVDLDLAKRWKHDCLNRHGDRCHNPLGIADISPAWLIDTVDECLISGSSVSEYIALSYRWSISTPFQNTRRALEGLKQSGALSTENLAVELSPTVRHAMKLTNALGERYLWVDVLCIVQDDEKHLQEQLQLMGAIYSSAKLTIVASDGDAADGIAGLRGISAPRNVLQDVVPAFDTFNIVLRSAPLFANLQGSTEYFQRGWTFQEYYLSKRRLIFVNQDIHWQCACAEWHEDLVQPEDAPRYDGEMARNLPELLATRTPNHSLLTRYLSEYNRRALSYPEDALAGISGFLGILGQSYQGGFLFGLPVACFDSALMWEAANAFSGREIHRRKAARKLETASSSTSLPSWSWVGWISDGLKLLEEETFELDKNSARTIPITRWYTHETPDSSVKTPVNSFWHRIRERTTDVSFKLPQGWARQEYNETHHKHARRHHADSPPPEGLGEFVYHNSKLPGKYFWLPIPTIDAGENAQLATMPQTPYISCQTKRGWFQATRRSRPERYPLTLDIRNGKPGVCGELTLHRKDDMVHFTAPDAEILVKVELVGVCRRKWDTVPQDIVCVLWVEWEDGVAYRKASGWVSRYSWEAHELEDVHLVLG